MAFYSMKFGEKSARHPSMKPRGADTRVFLPERACVNANCPSDPALTRPFCSETIAKAPNRPPSAQQPSLISDVGKPVTRPPSSTRLRHPKPASDRELAPIHTQPAHSTGMTTRPLFEPSASEVDTLFRRVDCNGNGLLSLAELDKAVLELWPQFNNKPAILRAYKAADRNGTGFVSKKEFALFVSYLKIYDDLFRKFETADTSGDRRLSKEEFVSAARRIPELTCVDASAVFDQLDVNGGGFLLFDEFCAWFVENIALPRNAALAPRRRPDAAKTRAKPRQQVISLPLSSTVTDTFSRVDFNGNGMLSLAELDKAVIELWPDFNNKPAVMRAYKAADRNGTGFISKKEFPGFLRYLIAYTNLFNTFSAMDSSRDRRLTLQEFVSGCDLVDELKPLSIEERKAEFAALDKNCGGFVLFDEFCAKFAEAEMRKAPRATGTVSVESVTLLCPYCRRMRPPSHLRACRDMLQEEIDTLPSALRCKIPPHVEPTDDDIRYFNNSWSPALHRQICALYACPHCSKQFQPSQGKPLAAHFNTHGLPPSSLRQISAERKEIMNSVQFAPPAKPAVIDPATVLHQLPLAQLVNLERQFTALSMANETPTVRALSRVLPCAPTEVLTVVARGSKGYGDVWKLITSTTSQASEIADVTAVMIVKLDEAGALARVEGLFDMRLAPPDFMRFLRQRPFQHVALSRFLRLTRISLGTDRTFADFCRKP